MEARRAGDRIGQAVLTLALFVLCRAAAYSAVVEFKIDRTGAVTASLRLDLPPAGPGSRDARLVGLVVPCTDEAKRLLSGPDIRARFLSGGPNYSTIALLVPATTDSVPLSIEHCLSLEETVEGKLKITIDYTYEFAGAIEQSLPSVTPREWAMTVSLPGEFDDTLVAFNPAAVQRRDRVSFALLPVEQAGGAKAAWIVFPNVPSQRQQNAKLVLGLLLGLLTCLLQVPVFRTRRTELLVGLVSVAAVVFAVVAYCAVVLPSRLDLLVWIGVSIPHIALALFGGTYVILAKRRQATIAGNVLVDSKPAFFGRATLLRQRGTDWKAVKTTEQLDQGKYRFHIWIGRDNQKLKVQVKASDRELAESKPFGLSRKQEYAVEDLECPARP